MYSNYWSERLTRTGHGSSVCSTVYCLLTELLGSTRVRQRVLELCCFLAISVPCALAQMPADADPGWPQEMDARGFHLVIYQPQVDRWKKDHLDVRAAVTVTRPGDSTPLYGIVSLTARTDVDKESRMVTLEDLKVSSASFPAAKSLESDWTEPSATACRSGRAQSLWTACSPTWR